jgi:redox-sensitive bicupin YhaK (pirin superfamily)
MFVNLPRKAKRQRASIGHFEPSDLPVVDLQHGGHVRLVAGACFGQVSPVRTHVDLTMVDAYLQAGDMLDWHGAEGRTTFAYVVAGSVAVKSRSSGGARTATTSEVCFFRAGAGPTCITASGGASHVVFFDGGRLGEPVVAGGPFVMNSEKEIVDAMRAYRLGEMGRLEPEGHDR